VLLCLCVCFVFVQCFVQGREGQGLGSSLCRIFSLPGPRPNLAQHKHHVPPPLPADFAAKRRQYPRPAFIGADLSRVSLRAALEGTGFDPSVRTLFLIEARCPCVWGGLF
jgi:hypothetical protein